MSPSYESCRLYPTPYAMSLADGSRDSVSAETRGLARDPGLTASSAYAPSAGSIIDGAWHAAACSDAIAIDGDSPGGCEKNNDVGDLFGCDETPDRVCRRHTLFDLLRGHSGGLSAPLHKNCRLFGA